MNREETILFLREAEKAFNTFKLTADAALKHATQCPVCRSRFKSAFWNCHDKDNLAFDLMTARVDAQHFQIELKALVASWERTGKPKTPVFKTPSLEWLEKLHKLEDNR